MLSWLFPYFLVGRCLLGDGTISEVKAFGPFDTKEEAEIAMSLLAYGFLCDTGEPFRHARWGKAIKVDVAAALAVLGKARVME